MAGDLGVAETTWLAKHLTDCPACSTVAAQYAADRLALRALREAAPEPPRDLWARTAAAIEQTSGGRPVAAHAPRRASRLSLGALSSLAVLAVVIGVSTLSADFLNRPQTASPQEPFGGSAIGNDIGGAPAGAQATPFAVGAGAVEWVDKTANGTLAYNNAAVDEVCPAEGTSSCPALEEAQRQRVAFESAPRTIIGSPKDGRAVLIADDGSGGDRLLVVDLPERTSAPVATSETPAPTPASSAVASDQRTATPIAPASPTAASGSPSPSSDAASASPSESPGTDTSGGEPTVTPPVPSPSLSPAPS